jgi:hypothetical protein
LGQTHYRVLGRQFTYPVALQRFDDISSIPWPRPRQLADEAISICFGIWIGGALDKRDRQVRQIDKRVRQLTDRLRGKRGRRAGERPAFRPAALDASIERRQTSHRFPCKNGRKRRWVRAVETINPYREDVWFLSLVPDTPLAVRRFFDQFRANAWPLGPLTWNRSRWGGVAWEQIHRFCQQENLTNTSRVLEFNREQLF